MKLHSRLFEIRYDLGLIADGVQWPNETISVKWRDDNTTAVYWDNTGVPAMDKVRRVHEHDGVKRIAFLDEE